MPCTGLCTFIDKGGFSTLYKVIGCEKGLTKAYVPRIVFDALCDDVAASLGSLVVREREHKNNL